MTRRYWRLIPVEDARQRDQIFEGRQLATLTVAAGSPCLSAMRRLLGTKSIW